VQASLWDRRCESCGATYGYDDPVWRCRCGGLLGVAHSVPYTDPVAGHGVWRYRRSLPVPDGVDPVSLGEGGTPLIPLAGEHDVYAKVEYESPTGAFKDRGTTVVVTRFRRLGLRHVIEDSSGNAGASMAAYCAAAGIRCTVYVPAAASAAKLTQMRTYDAEVVPIAGDRTAVGEAAIAAARDAYYASHAWDPYYSEGTKTAAFEIAEQLGGAPARVVLPVGQGTMLLGLAKGFREMFAAGRIQRLPSLIAVQSDACAPLYEPFHRHLDHLPAVRPKPGLLAEGIASASPLRWRALLEAVWESRGSVVRVGDDAIPGALAALGRRGLFVEPTTAVVYAALGEFRGAAGQTVLILTGSGLKASGIIERFAEEPVS
jgi:threonine synthase